ncbi:MAG: NAD(P)-binding domain-containing protein [Rhodobacteraceae bacterium]|nr:NAD(P)-binding domain-containing protein [Paracoccaceae bacterium]
MTRAGFIGTGHIAAPMARALARKGHQVVVSERSIDVSQALVAEGLGITSSDNQGVIDASDVVFLCLRPAIWSSALSGLTWHDDQSIVSVMAGVPISALVAACAPVADVSVTIPIGFIENGGCPLPVAGDPKVLQGLFGDDNPVLPQPDERALNAHFTASAMLSGILEFMETGASWLAKAAGDPAQAEIYVANLVAGFLRDMPKSKAGDMASAKWALATPGTLNLQMVERLRSAESFAALPDILSAISNGMEKPDER